MPQTFRIVSSRLKSDLRTENLEIIITTQIYKRVRNNAPSLWLGTMVGYQREVYSEGAARGVLKKKVF